METKIFLHLCVNLNFIWLMTPEIVLYWSDVVFASELAFLTSEPCFRIGQDLNSPLSQSCENVTAGVLDDFEGSISLWPVGSGSISSTLQCSVRSSQLRSLIHISGSSQLLATFSYVLRTTLTGFGKFLASVAFSLAPDQTVGQRTRVHINPDWRTPLYPVLQRWVLVHCVSLS